MKRFLKKLGLVLFSLAFFGAGISHFVYPEGFAALIPSIIPFAVEIVYATGVMEMVLAILLLVPSMRPLIGKLIAIFLVVVFPANIYAAIVGIPAPWSEEVNQTALWIRLLFQPLLIWWVLVISKK
ncbi:DoxX family protein [Thalassobacillus hwangdonensis]|uniref:DoxX family protein n=1 Tax=Thalassobacillus hwangdonensis TaxID=546108 RepID=A0ABW3L101_9BACI